MIKKTLQKRPDRPETGRHGSDTSAELTARQEQLLRSIEVFIGRFGYPPSIRELAKRMAIASPRGVQRHLEALAKKGFIKRNSLARGIQIIKGKLGSARETLSALPDKISALSDSLLEKIPARVLPLLGRVAAGTPITAEQNVEEMIAVPAALAPTSRGDQFILRVKGDSMIDDHIQEGDMVIVRQQSTAETGQIVVAMIEGEATVKRFYQEKDRIRLEPANKNYQPIYAEGAQVTIIGRVTGLLRSLK